MSSVEQDLKHTDAAEEQEYQEQQAAELYRRWPLPTNVSELKSYAWGKFTWRDILFSMGALLIAFLITMPLRLFLPDWAHIIAAAVVGLPLVFVVNKHAFTGDLPIEDKVKISLSDRGQSNLLHWDKTKKWDAAHQIGKYIDSSTQSFVPDVKFITDLTPYGGPSTGMCIAVLPGNEGGFTVLKIDVDDMSAAKFSELNQVVFGFNTMFNRLIDDTVCMPIQIMLKSVPQNLSGYIDRAFEDSEQIARRGKPLMHARARDYWYLLGLIDQSSGYFYDYYMIVSYRKDAEGVGDDSMKSASVRRERMKEKANPLRKRQEAVANMDFEIGADRKKQIRERMKENEFGESVTVKELMKRTQVVLNTMSNIGSGESTSSVRPHVLSEIEIAKLFFQCYNEDDKNVVDSVLQNAMADHEVLLNKKIYEDFPNLFATKPKKIESATKRQQKSGVLSAARRR